MTTPLFKPEKLPDTLESRVGIASVRARMLAMKNSKSLPLEDLQHALITAYPKGSVILLQCSEPYLEQWFLQLLWGLWHPEYIAGKPQALALDNVTTTPCLCFRFYPDDALKETDKALQKIRTTDIPAVIACSRFSDVPPAFFHAATLRLELPAMSAPILQGVLRDLYPDTRISDIGPWASAIKTHDILYTQRLAMPAADAVTALADIAKKRLLRLTDPNSPNLHGLFGMGEAKIVAQDLVNDIRLAQQGKLEWQQIDKGILLNGSPGTGKTALAKAIAKECSIPFLSASAAEWQQAGNLYAHLANIRQSFAQARQLAPAILFIDEFDSIGSRDSQLRTRSYSVPVINCLLEELDGISDRGDIIVIAATNHADNIDPALRRPGRLDQTIQVPFPNKQALISMYQYYILMTTGHGKCAIARTDIEKLAGMSIGLTGADIQRIIKGAYRRARKEEKPLQHDHVLQELIKAPRQESGHSALSEESLRHLAVYYAGQLCMMYLQDSSLKQFGVLSLLPNSDGAFGSLVCEADESPSMTRKDYDDMVLRLLAGRAAETVIFGEGKESGLFGNNGSNSDFGRASNIAKHLFDCTAIGVDNDFFWQKNSEKPFPSNTPKRSQSYLGTMTESAINALSANKIRLSALSTIIATQTFIDKNKILTTLETGDINGQPRP